MALAPSGSALIVYMTDNSIRRFQLDLRGRTPRVIEVTGASREGGRHQLFEALCFGWGVCGAGA